VGEPRHIGLVQVAPDDLDGTGGDIRVQGGKA
jgi:hypothetical protein